MKTFLGYFALLCLINAQAQDSYLITVDLRETSNDKLPITVIVPRITQFEADYHMPKIVPGTYSISDFGRFVTDFAAWDSVGNQLVWEKTSANTWKISNAQLLRKITYLVGDTYDKTDGYSSEFIFEPGGTSFEANRNIFVLNTFGLVGYIEGYKFNPYELTIERPKGVYGATSLKRSSSSETSDTFTAESYNFLADAPLLYCEPDTVTREIAGAKILISVCSPNKQLSANDVMNNINDLMVAQANYLGGKLPIDRYAYLIYLLDFPSLSHGWGALEHSYSSLYTLPEMYASFIGQTIRDVAAHEFLHIVTPLNIHSEQIHNFDYIDPQMSQHLWLYEGVTEYSSMHVQVRNDLYSREVFLEQVQSKINNASNYPEVSFTEMSEQVLTPPYKDMYLNVYEKGALIGMCLDLHLIKYSNGQMDLPQLMQTLAQNYGPMKAFDDDSLFEEITRLTQPEIGEFLKTYVSGAKPLPLRECLDWAGVVYQEPVEKDVATLGQFGINMADDQIVISGIDEMNAFGKAMGYQEGDVIKSINGQDINRENAMDILESFREDVADGSKVTVVVQREVKGKSKQVKLKGKAMMVKVQKDSDLFFSEEPTEAQLIVRTKWLKG